MKRRPEHWLSRRGGAVELLRLPAALFGWGAGARAALYSCGLFPVERVDAPVVSVGNLTAGGTGKTPFVHTLVREFLRRGERPGIVSRGYGAKGGENDETRMARALVEEGVLMREAPRRAEGARALIEQGASVIVMDDGFQHRSLARDLDLVLCDATRPFGLPASPGGGAPVRAFLPRGLMREKPGALARADAIVLTRVDQVSPEALAELEAELLRYAPGTGILHACHQPVRLRRSGGGASAELPLAMLEGRAVDLVSGIGNPEAFEETVRRLGARVEGHRVFPDHHGFVEGDLEGLGIGETLLVTTAKDAVKWGSWRDDALAVEVELVIVRGEKLFAALLDALPLSSSARRRDALHAGLHG